MDAIYFPILLYRQVQLMCQLKFMKLKVNHQIPYCFLYILFFQLKVLELIRDFSQQPKVPNEHNQKFIQQWKLVQISNHLVWELVKVEVQVMVLVWDRLHHLLCCHRVQVQEWEWVLGQELGWELELACHCYHLFYYFNLDYHQHCRHCFHPNHYSRVVHLNHLLLDPIHQLVGLLGLMVLNCLLVFMRFQHSKLIIRFLFDVLNLNFLEIKIIFRIIKDLPYFVFFSFFHSFSR